MSEASDSTFVDPSYAEPHVADGPAERERESARTEETRYAREARAEDAGRRAAVERLKADLPPESIRD
jgi:hypothetical protein